MIYIILYLYTYVYTYMQIYLCFINILSSLLCLSLQQKHKQPKYKYPLTTIPP